MSAHFDVERQRRDKIAQLSREVDGLRQHRAQLERLLGIACQVAVGGSGMFALALLDVIEVTDREAQAEPWPIPLEQLTDLLGGPA